ncbi:MAG: zinc-ribbon domain-containing protein [Acutalibacteraceae bacterium]
MYCHSCGAQLDDNCTFCYNCGAKMSVWDEKKPSSSNSKKRLKKYGFGAISVCLVISLIAGAVIFSKSNNDKVEKTLPEGLAIKTLDANSAISNDSTDWREMTFLLDGAKYTMPFKASELTQNGWKCEAAETGVLSPHGKNSLTFKYSSHVINVTVKNFDSLNSLSIGDCYVCEVDFNWADPIFASNIMPQVSTKSDVIEAYGKPKPMSSEQFFYYFEGTEFDHDKPCLSFRFSSEAEDAVLMYASISSYDVNYQTDQNGGTDND